MDEEKRKNIWERKRYLWGVGTDCGLEFRISYFFSEPYKQQRVSEFNSSNPSILFQKSNSLSKEGMIDQ